MDPNGGKLLVFPLNPAHPILRKDGVVRPFDTLPPELVSNIFERSAYFRTTVGDSKSRSRFPMVLLQICRRWRSIAIATPTLWTDIVILSSEKSHHLDLDAARLYVERSGSCPISLTWYHTSWNQNPVVHDILFPTSPRLRNITIYTTGFDVRDSLLVVLEAMPFHILEYLRCHANQHPYPVVASLAAVELNAPRLRHGIFTNYIIPAGNFSSMVTLEIGLFGFIRQFIAAAFFDLLRNVSQTLKCLRLRITNRALQGYTSSAPKIQLPALAVLDLRFTSELLLFISTPNLHTLCLEGYHENTISPFISFDAPKLTHLKLETLPLLDLETIPGFPWRFQELETVILYRCQSTKSFFYCASSTRGGTPAFPSLTSIIFNDPDAFPSIRSMVEGQKAADLGRPTLRWLRFLTEHHVPGLAHSDMEWITAQGIAFSEGRDMGESWTTRAV